MTWSKRNLINIHHAISYFRCHRKHVINSPSKSSENVKTRQKHSEKRYFSLILKLLINIIIHNTKKLNFFRYEPFVFYKQRGAN